MAKQKRLTLAIVAMVVLLVVLLWQTGYLTSLLGGGEAPPSEGANTYGISVQQGSVVATGGSPTVTVTETSTTVSGSQATMGAVTQIALKLQVRHLSGSAARSFTLTFENPAYTVPSSGTSFYVYDRDQYNCPQISFSVDSGGTGSESSCKDGKQTFYGLIELSGGSMTISVTYTMNENLWQAGGGNPPVGTKVTAAIHGTGMSDYSIVYVRNS